MPHTHEKQPFQYKAMFHYFIGSTEYKAVLKAWVEAECEGLAYLQAGEALKLVCRNFPTLTLVDVEITEP